MTPFHVSSTARLAGRGLHFFMPQKSFEPMQQFVRTILNDFEGGCDFSLEMHGGG